MKLVVFPDLLKGRVNSYTKKDGTFVQAHDNGRMAAAPKVKAAQKAVKSALYDKDDAALGQHKVGDTVSYKGERGAVRTAKVKGVRDGKVVVEHKAGYTEMKHHGELSSAQKPAPGAPKVGVRASAAKKAAPAAGAQRASGKRLVLPTNGKSKVTADSAKDHAVQAGAKFRSGVGVFASAEAAHAHAAKLAGGKGGAFVMNHPDHGYHVVVNGANAQRMEKSGYRHAKELKTVLTAK